MVGKSESGTSGNVPAASEKSPPQVAVPEAVYKEVTSSGLGEREIKDFRSREHESRRGQWLAGAR